MKLYILMILWIDLGQLDISGEDVHGDNKLTAPPTCAEMNFDEKGACTSFETIPEVCKVEYNDRCDDAHLNLDFKLDGCFYTITLGKGNKTADCQGYAMNYTDVMGNLICNYSQISKPWKDVLFEIPVKCPGKEIYNNYSIFLLTKERHQEIQYGSLESPDECRLDVLHFIECVLSKGYCSNAKQKFGIRKKEDITHSICTNSQHNNVSTIKDNLKKKLASEYDCAFSNTTCERKPVNGRKDTEPEKATKSNNILVIAIIVPSVIILIVGLCWFFQVKRRTTSASRMNDIDSSVLADFEASDATVLEIPPTATKSKTPSVMILNRPGCELLESLLRDLAYILTSYGIHVKAALLEQNQLDAEGGIASYMQKNIKDCDFILVMCTENTPEDGFLRHRPYEFALKIIGGMAFHQNDCSRYIPMYLTTYNEAVEIIPSFLNASTIFGYCLPNDIKDLIRKIMNIECIESNNERKAKDDFFTRRMNDHKKRILEIDHPHCLEENCTKGLGRGSVDNLTSIWPSTVQSKWLSTESLTSREDNTGLQVIPYHETVLSKVNTMLNGKALTTDEVIAEKHLLLNVEEGETNTLT